MPSITSDYLKIISLNIEKNKHLSQVIPFFHQQKPDIIMLQEVLLADIPVFVKALKMEGLFTPMRSFQAKEGAQILGLATFSALPITKSHSTYYFGDKPSIPVGFEEDPLHNLNTARAILVTEILKENKTYCFINTHFTWTPDGQESERQHHDLQRLFSLLSQIPDFILCGDFNAPRGRVIFSKIAAKYKDNIPLHITTTIDKNLHKAGDLQLVVDGLFSTPQYSVEDVEVFEGLSDHCAISAKVHLNCSNKTK